MFKTPKAEDPLPLREFLSHIFWVGVIVFILPSLVIIIYGEPMNNDRLPFFDNKYISIGFFFLLTILIIIFEWHGFLSCRRKHFELLDRYGEKYVKVLKEDLDWDRMWGFYRSHWEYFEKRMAELE